MCKQMKFLTCLGTLSLPHKSKKHRLFTYNHHHCPQEAQGPAGQEVTDPYDLMQKLLQGCEERAI